MSTSSQDAQLQARRPHSGRRPKAGRFADVTSGSKAAVERQGMKKLIEYAEAGDTVVVSGASTALAASLIDVLNTVNLLRERGVHVRSISDGIDPTTSTGRLMLNMLATLAEYERELIVERVNAGIAAARQNGTRFGRPLSDPAVIADKLAIAADARRRPRRRRRSTARRMEPRHPVPSPASPRPPASPRRPRERRHVANVMSGEERWRPAINSTAMSQNFTRRLTP